MLTASDLFIDTSGWVYFLDSRDPLHSLVVSFVKQAVKKRRRLVTTNYIITELVALLSSRFHLPRQQVIKAINLIKKDASVEIVYIERAMDDEAWTLLEQRLDKEWSLVDASSFIVMKRFGMIEALTTDHHFTQAGFSRVPKNIGPD
jgi:predicted nucleic acid-binding protein